MNFREDLNIEAFNSSSLLSPDQCKQVGQIEQEEDEYLIPVSQGRFDELNIE